MNAGEFLRHPQSWHILLDFALIGLFGGFFIVPLYAMLQTRSDPTLVAIYIFTLVPEFLLRFVLWILIHTLYRVRTTGMESVPEKGPALLVCNHVSFIDALVVGTATPRPPRFLMDHLIFKVPVLKWLFIIGKAIPVAQSKEDPAMKARAFDLAAQALRDGDLVMIFPEGMLTRDGEFRPFRGGILEILKREPVPVIPMALRGLWGSFFSRIEGGVAMKRPFRRGLFNKVELVVGPAIAPGDVTVELLQSEVARLRGEVR
jgi:1-acyl-sn-glycerol-3-phosphate acyltransferase